jgi:Aspartyl protease
MTVATLPAETHYPGSVASITPRFVAGALIVIPVRINQEGPFDFVVDTGGQVTMIDPALASQLQLRLQGSVGIISVAGFARGSMTVLDTLEADSQTLEKPLALVQDLGAIQAAQAANGRIRGILGENFLSHFDLMIDYAHKLLCLDPTTATMDRVRGERIPLVRPHPESELLMERLLIATHLSGAGTRPILLQVDSGSNGPLLYARSEENAFPLLNHATPRKGNLTPAQRAFAALPPQELRIGKRTMRDVRFVTPVSVAKNVARLDEDGLLPTLLFQRVFISGADRYVAFDPKF